MDQGATPGQTARWLVRASDRASLATVTVEGGWPYASLVVVACDHAGTPLLMISDLAEHTKNLQTTEGRCALLFDGTAGYANPLTGPRVTVLGRLIPSDDERLLARFLARHPDAESYAGFSDFRLYRMAVERAHLVAGFGRICWIEAEDFLFDTNRAAALAQAEAEIVSHMNEMHPEAVGAYARRLLDAKDGGWQMTGIDPEGIDLRAGGRIARVAFSESVSSPEEARNALINLDNQARLAYDRGN